MSFIKIEDGYVIDCLKRKPNLEGYFEVEDSIIPLDVLNRCYQYENGKFLFNKSKFEYQKSMMKVITELGSDFDDNGYETIVLIGIRKKYSLQDEQALIRQKDEKPEEWSVYYDYCEQCKKEAKEQLGIERTLEDAKKEKKREIEKYDNSDAVNSFFVNGMPTWIPGEKRSQYMASIASARIMAEDEIELPLLGQMISLPLDNAEKMLARLQRYGDNAANCTDQHYINVNLLTSINEVDNYNYRSGYPDKVTFEIDL